MHALRRSYGPHAGDAAAAASCFKALADPHRLTIFATIAASAEPVCVCHLGDGLPLLQPTISHHLKVLRDAGLVTGERQGTWVYYRMKAGALDRLRAYVGVTTRKEWTYEDPSVAVHKLDRRKRGVLSKLARRTSA
jgi:ArsR family transcriptional regulator, arsenate/arsenite/antimonite-responsive transcriptional repressor